MADVLPFPPRAARLPSPDLRPLSQPIGETEAELLRRIMGTPVARRVDGPEDVA